MRILRDQQPDTLAAVAAPSFPFSHVQLKAPVETAVMVEPTERLARQLATLEKREPALVRGLRDVDLSVAVEAGRNGELTAAVAVGGRPLNLHSRYRPREEAERYCSTQVQDPFLPCVLVGLGLGYHAECLLDNLAPETPLWVFEPDAGVFLAALAHRDLDCLLTSSKVRFFCGVSRAELLQTLHESAAMLADGVQFVIPAVTRQRDSDYVETVEAAVNDAVSYAKVLRETRRRQSRTETRNVIANLWRYANSEPVGQLEGKWKGRPAVVVGAGPSLTRTLPALSEAVGRFPIIAVGAALRQLQQAGISPDVVVHVDYSELCARQFQNVEAERRTFLLAGASASTAPLELWPGRFAMIRHPFADRLLGPLAPRLPDLKQGTSVAHSAFYFAEFLQADPIILVGLDLAFTDGLYYSAGNALHEQWRPELNRFYTLETKEWERLVRRKAALVRTADATGAPLFTDQQMALYLQQFERDFAQSKATVIDATQGGVCKAGARSMPLADALSQFSDAPGDISELDSHESRPKVDRKRFAAQLEAACDNLRAFQGVLEEIGRRQKEILETAPSPDQRRRILRKLAQLQNRVTADFLAEFQIASAYDPNVEFERDAQSQRIRRDVSSPQEKAQAEFRRDVNYARGLSTSVEQVLHLVKEVVSAISSGQFAEIGDD